jgi:hypothetical protein
MPRLSPTSAPPRLRVRLLAALVLLLALPFVAARADDDEIGVVSTTPDIVDVNDVDANFDQWLFPGAANAAAGRLRLQTQIKMQLAEIERSCQLTGEQKDRLGLAARGDLSRFLEQVDALRRKFDTIKHDQQKMGQIWQEIQPLQARQARGLSGPDSLISKTVARTLSAEQSKQFDDAQLDRRRFRYHASIGVTLNAMEGTVALTDSQRQALVKILQELPPPRAFGQYDQYFIHYRLASIPADKLQPLFDTRQWQALQPVLNQGRAMRQNLIDQGYLLREDLDTTAPVEIKR